MKSKVSPRSQSLSDKDSLGVIDAKTGPYPAARSWSGGRRRIVGKGPFESYCYHAMSRTCSGDLHFDDVEKEALRRLLWKMSEFCGVKVVTYCVMSNHFHVLVDVPWREVWLRRFEGAEGEARLLEHLRTLYSKTFVAMLKDELEDLRRRGMVSLAEEKIEAIKKRFCDLSIYVKEVKERFSRWFNKRRGRKGTLWMDRFKSVLVEGKGEPLHTMAAYIDLNPVRAGLVNDPKDYRWCGYAEALSGSRRAQRAMSKVTAKPVDGWESAGGAEAYRKLLYSHAVEVRSADKSEVVRRGVSAEESKAVLEAKGKLTAAELVRLRVRYFSDGLVIGGKEFVESIFGQHREKFGPRRKDGARKIAESASGLFALRRLRKQALGRS
ncbi:MAG: chemotaxis protein CheW [Verrucomicrobiaceae bacterium]|nr:chemotaxis protein CheW [Verrucomicrobiaceae bacterium]